LIEEQGADLLQPTVEIHHSGLTHRSFAFLKC